LGQSWEGIGRMRILHINKFFSPLGGAETIMLEEAKAFEKEGHEIFFYATDKKPFFDENLPYISKFSKYTNYSSLSPVNMVKSLPKIIYDKDAAVKFENFINEIQPDIVHCHEFFYNLTPSFLDVLKRKKIPAVMTIHTPRLVCPAGTLMKKKQHLCEDIPCATGNSISCIQNACVDKNTAKSTVFAMEFAARSYHRLLETFQYFIAPSQILLELSMRSGLPKEKFTLIHNFIDDKYFDSTPNYNSGDYFLFVGRLANDKGVKYLIEAMNLLPREIPLRIVGTGPQEEEFKALAQKYELNNITFVGHKKRHELVDEYRNCIASLLPCYWFEAFGLVIVEAFTQGKPVLASKVGAIPEIIENGINGFTFEAKNVQEIASYINKLYNDRSLVQLMGRNARKKAEKMYTAKLHYNRLLDLYNNAIQQAYN
jgi:glycosyltransferase involved in cell wall biosynthesis